MYKDVDFSVLLGKTLTKVEVFGSEEIIFETTEGETFRMFHYQDCCESVTIEDICGDIQALVGSPIVLAEVVSNSDDSPSGECYDGSYTWTFYRIANRKFFVTIRWYGESNGWYSESVDFVELLDDE